MSVAHFFKYTTHIILKFEIDQENNVAAINKSLNIFL